MFEYMFGSKKPPWIARGRFVDANSNKAIGVRCSGILARLPTVSQPGLFFDANKNGYFEIRHDGELFNASEDKHYWIRCSQPWMVVPNSNQAKSFYGTKFCETDEIVDGVIQREVGDIPVVDQIFAARLTECIDVIAAALSIHPGPLEGIRLFFAKKRRRVGRRHDSEMKELFDKAKENDGVLLTPTSTQLPKDLFFQISGKLAHDFIQLRLPSEGDSRS